MARYANHECSDCSVVLPANELTKLTVRVLDSTHTSRRFYNIGRSGFGFGSGSSETYRIRHLEVCDDCYDYRARLAKRQAFMRFIGLVVIAVVIIFVIAAIVGQSSSKKSELSKADAVQANAYSDANSPQVVNVANPFSETLVPESSSSDQTAIYDDSPSSPVADNSAAMEQDRNSVLPISEAADSNSSAIAKATTTALARGIEQPWQVGGDTGYVMVSRPIIVGLTTCRNVYSTTRSNGSETQSPNVTWCQTDGAEWIAKPS